MKFTSFAALAAILASLHGSAHAQDTYTLVPGPASGHAAFASPQITVTETGVAADTQQVLPGTVKRGVTWTEANSGTGGVILPSGSYVDAYAIMISEAGTIGGYGVNGAVFKPLRWDGAGVLTTLDTLNPGSGGAMDSRVNAMGADGTAVGFSQIFDDLGTTLGTRGVFWAAGGTAVTALSLASSDNDFGQEQARVISPSGLIAGDGTLYVEGVAKGTRGIRWSADRTTATTLQAVNTNAAGSGVVETKGINDAGTIAANSRKYNGNTDLGLRAVRYEADSSTPVELGVIGTNAAGANADTTAIAIDRFGNIAGLSQAYAGEVTKGTRPVLWRTGSTAPVQLAMSGFDSAGAARGNMSAMNNKGFIAGTLGTYTAANVSIGRRAVIWGFDGELYNLNLLIPQNSGWTLTVATDISDSGWVGGYGSYDPDGAGPMAAYERYWTLYSEVFTKAPDLRVTESNATLADGTSTVAYGSVVSGIGSVQKTITLHNDGTRALLLGSVAVTGANPGNFVADTTGLPSSLAAGASASFTVTFSTPVVGARAATVQVLSSDLESPVFDIPLTGTGLEPVAGALAFQNAEVTVNEKDLIISIPVTRTNGSDGAVSVKVNSNPGTASQADFVALNNVEVNFANGDSAIKFVTVTVANDLLVEPEEAFILTLSNPQGGAVLGAQQTVIIRIEAAEVVKPTVAITTPASKQVVNHVTGTPVSITGTAADNDEVAKVQVSLNGGAYVDATLTPATSGVTWRLDINPPGGANNLSVRALDADGNSTVVTRAFTYKKLSALNVIAGTGGKVTGGKSGAVYEVGKTYTLTAVPNAGQAFNGWTGAGLTTLQTEVAKLTFVFTDALFDSPTITAAFMEKPFILSEVGSFNGLVTPRTGSPFNNQTHGFLNLNLTVAGSFSGTLKMDGFSLSIGGLFTNDGAARFGPTRVTTLQVERTNKSSLEIVQLQWHRDSDTITGVVNQYLRRTLISQSDFTLDRAAFSRTVPVAPAAYTQNGGKYTVIIPAQSQNNGLLDVDFTQGTGFGLITITPAGVVSLSGTLADDTIITASAPLSSALKAPLFAQLYSTRGSFSALIALDASASSSDLKAENAVWFRPFQNKMHYYPFGWEEGLVLDLFGAKYTAGSNAIPGLLAASNEGNAGIRFSAGQLDSTLTNGFNISSANAVTQLPALTETPFSLSILGNTGDVKGTFTHTNGTTPAFKGKIYQKGSLTGAHGFFKTIEPKPVTGEGEIGSVRLFRMVLP